ncbi:dCTP deaminase [Pseudoxanthomonas sp. CF125]|uniref:dCTP deaminase n=1 Tax=Pseudoxanthomonas sp. CF125 TaxID=1855303 RepID=UPI00088C03AB|nr:dCTP deaminase [Pseudoxanthomonas sp. CF125]SDR10562.1 dCTP deaminase [Pseudoxanthomonas sp. CF125]
MSVLGNQRLIDALRDSEPEKRLVVTPLLNPTQVGEASIDIRLGNDFVVTRRGNLPSIDPAGSDPRSARYNSRHYANFGSKFYLHPNELVLASTLEYVKLPFNLSAWVTSRSRWGRVGLVIATATAIQPGFAGTITLELVNLGEVPLVLYPGLLVAQIIFSDCEGAAVYTGSFAEQVDPGHGNVSADVDMAFWTHPAN